MLSSFAFAQEALITGYVDSPCSGANGRVLEIYVDGTIDFTGWNVQRQSNGGGFTTNLDLSTLGSISNDFVYLTNDAALLDSEFGITTNVISNGGINSNGNDAFQIVDNSGSIIDRFGEDGVDGSGTNWEHEDTYYMRNNGSTANAGAFDASNWTFGAQNVLDGQGACNGGTALGTLVPLGNFTPASTDPTPAPLGLGQMSFTAFNADADDDFAMVTFTDIPANTTIYFSDKEWTGTGFNSGEASYSWETGAAVIPAGSVIAFNNISATATVTYGTIVGSPGGLSSGSEAIFAYLGTDVDTPTEFIAAVANSTSAYGSFENTGLVEGLTAVTLPEGADIADYMGPRTGLDRVGYQLALNQMSNYNIQDTGDDDSADGVTPDLPFDLTMFNLTTTNVSAPQVVHVSAVDQNTVQVVFSEETSEATAINIANYSFSPAVNISNIVYNSATSTATVTHDGFVNGTAYVLYVDNVEDVDGLEMLQAFSSHDLFYNNLTIGLLITEVMYNAPSSVSNALEFIEIYNNTEATIALGGIMVKDEDNFVFTFPEMNLASEGIVLLATDKTTADAFYGVEFLDMPQGIVNALGNGGEVLEIFNSENQVIFTMEYDDSASWPLADGAGPSLELLDPTVSSNDPFNWTAATNLVGPSEGIDVFASPGVYVPVVATVPTITFDQAYIAVNETDGTATLNLSITAQPTVDATVDVVILQNESSAVENENYVYTSETVTFTTTGALTQQVTINIPNNTDAEPDTMLALELTNPVNATLAGTTVNVVYILNDEVHSATAPNGLGIEFLTSYAITGDNPGSEILAHDAASERLFVMNSGNASVEILDFSTPSNIAAVSTIDLSAYGDGGTSVAYKNGILAAAIVAPNTGDNGTIVFMDVDGNVLSTVEAGALPDMITFTPDGSKLMVANEGEPNTDYSIDPEGTVSIVDLSNGAANLTQTDVTSLNFNAFDSQMQQLKDASVRLFGINATVSQDLEPEYITVSEDSQMAWVVLQENNAVAVVDLSVPAITDILPLGLKDHSLPENALDTSNEQDFIFMANWPIKGMFMPDGIDNYTVNGTTYFVTANEGDAREYDALEEEVNLEDVVLDASVFENQAFLQLEENLGKINMTNATGDTDNDGEFEEIHVFGGRSFSIFNGTTGELVYDSGADFEYYIAEDPVYSAIFNTTDDENNLKNRSDNKGPEPEAMLVQEIDGQFYAFIGLERIGGFMVYNISNPNAVSFEGYFNNRSTAPGEDIDGDLAPESIVYVAPEDNSEDKGLLVIANEVSATVSVYIMQNNTLSTPGFEQPENTVVMYPNPATNRTFFTQPTDFVLYDLNGRKLLEGKQATHIDLSGLSTGTYLVKNANGKTQKLLVN